MFDSVDPLVSCTDLLKQCCCRIDCLLLDQMVPAFSTFNKVLGMFIWGLVIMAVYFTNTWNTGYLPIVSNRVYDHFGEYYNVSRALDERGMYDHEKYMNYSAAYLGAGNTIVYCAFFGIYTAAITHVILFHRYEITMGFKNLWNSIRRRKTVDGVEGGEYKDVHNRLMAVYPEGMFVVHPPNSLLSLFRFAL